MNKEIKRMDPLAVEPIPRLLAKYAIPSIVSMLVMSIYNIVDQLFIAKGVGYLGNGATTVIFPLVTVALSLSLLIGNGSAALFSLERGRGNEEAARGIVGNTVILLAVAGIGMMALTLAFQMPLLRLLGATDRNMPHAVAYSRYIAMGFPFVMMSTGLANLIRADGSPRYSMFSNMSGAVLNTILDPIFIFVLHMGVAGAAIATAISQAVSFVLTVLYLFRYARDIRLHLGRARLQWDVVKRIAALGSSSFINQVSIAIVNVVLVYSLKYYGAQTAFGADIPISAMGIIMKINQIFIACILGISIGAQPILGFNYGAGNHARVVKTYRAETMAAFVLSLTASILFVATPEFFVNFFRDENPVFNEFAAMAMRIYLCCVFAAGIQIPSAGYFQAVGKPLRAMTLTMSRQLLILVPAMLLLPMLFGFDGILWSMPVTDILALCVTLFFIIREQRMLIRKARAQGPELATGRA